GPDNRAATPDDLRAMERLLAEALDAGAFGYSTGLVYPPSVYASTDELIGLTRSMATRGGLYFSHVRGEAATLEEAIAEAIQIGGERWRTPMGSIGFDQIFVATCSRPELEGLDLAHLGRATGGTPAEAMLSLVAEERAGVSMVVFSQSEDNVAKVLAHPAVMIGSDSLGLSAGPGPHPGKPHPRMYGTFPRVLGVYARDKKLFAWETAVHKMTGMPAAKLRLRDRGLVRPGYAADLVVFDPAR